MKAKPVCDVNLDSTFETTPKNPLPLTLLIKRKKSHKVKSPSSVITIIMVIDKIKVRQKTEIGNYTFYVNWQLGVLPLPVELITKYGS